MDRSTCQFCAHLGRALIHGEVAVSQLYSTIPPAPQPGFLQPGDASGDCTSFFSERARPNRLSVGVPFELRRGVYLYTVVQGIATESAEAEHTSQGSALVSPPSTSPFRRQPQSVFDICGTDRAQISVPVLFHRGGCTPLPTISLYIACSSDRALPAPLFESDRAER